MSNRPHRYTKPDANQAQIVDELRALGFDVDIVSSLPGIYDLVVSGDKWIMGIVIGCAVRVEVKQEGKELNETEVRYWLKQKAKDSLIKAESAECVLRWFGRV